MKQKKIKDLYQKHREELRGGNSLISCYHANLNEHKHFLGNKTSKPIFFIMIIINSDNSLIKVVVNNKVIESTISDSSGLTALINTSDSTSIEMIISSDDEFKLYNNETEIDTDYVFLLSKSEDSLESIIYDGASQGFQKLNYIFCYDDTMNATIISLLMNLLKLKFPEIHSKILEEIIE